MNDLNSVRHLNPADHNPVRIAKADKDFPKRVDFKDIKLTVKTRDTHKIEKKNYIGINMFGYENKVNYLIYVSKKCCEDNCHMTGYRGSAYRDCNINVNLNQKIPVIFHNLKNYDSHLIRLKIKVIPNGLEKYMSFSINNNLSFIGSFQLIILH